VNEDDPAVRAPTPPAGSLRPSAPDGGIPEPRGAPQDQSGPADTDDRPGPHGRVLRRLMILLGLALAGIAAVAWAIALFPKHSQLVNPTSFEVDIHSQTPLDTVYLVVSRAGQSTMYQLTVYVTTGIYPGAGGHQNEGDLSIYVPGDFPVSCSPGAQLCSYQPGYVSSVVGYTTMTEPITIGGGGENRPYTMTINDPRFGFASNNESAVAELPTIEGTGLAKTMFDVGYNIPSPHEYDWSIPPQVYSTADLAYWPEGPPANVSNSEAVVQSVEVTGTNQQAQAQDNRDTFISGLLFGVAGGAAIAAVQEGLHMIFDNRDDSGLPKPSRPSTRG
jgi:hypothetical protein